MTASGRTGLFCVVSGLALTLAGCAMKGSSEGSGAAVAGLAVTGQVHGGQQPISGASVQLYAANMGASKGASTALLTTPVLTDKDGGFSTGPFSCPATNPLIYVVATGGNPGLTGSVNNAQIALMSLVGTCAMLDADTSLSVNELTTVASVEALAPFMASYKDVGVGAGNTAGLSGAYAGAAGMVDFETGTLQTATPGVTIPGPLLYTLADILAACVDTAGGTAGDGSACGTLLADAGNGAATETVGAMVDIVGAPAMNVTKLYKLASADGPFQPGLGKAPVDFSVPLVIQLPRLTKVLPQGYFLLIDSAQKIWVYSSAERYDASTETYEYATGSVTIFNNNGTVFQTIEASANGGHLPAAGVADPFGNVWVLNLDSTVSKFGPSGETLSAGGYPFPFQIPPNLSYSPGSEGDDISSLASDISGNLWGLASGPGTGCYNELSADGGTISASGNFCQTVGDNTIAESVADGHGNVWFLGTSSISKIDPSGNYLLSGTNSNGCFDFYGEGDSRAATDTLNLAYDRFNDQVWGMGFFSVGSLKADGTQVFCDTNGEQLPLIYPSEINGVFTFLQLIVSTVDGGGNLFFASGGELENGNDVTYIGGLNILSPTGVRKTPFDPASGVYGLQAANTLQPGINNGGVQGLAIDAYGNIWSANNISFTLTKIPGLAVPKNYQ